MVKIAFLVLVAALAAAPSFAAGSSPWDSIADTLQADRGTTLSRQQNGKSPVYTTANAALYAKISHGMEAATRQVREMCIPSLINYTPGNLSSRTAQTAFKGSADLIKKQIPAHLARYMNGEISLLDLMVRYEGVMAQAEELQYNADMAMQAASALASRMGAGGGGGGAAQMGPNMTAIRSTNPEATVMPKIVDQNRFVASMFPGTTYDCLAGNGQFVFGGGQGSFTYSAGRPWQHKEITDGVSIVINQNGGGYQIELSIGTAGREPLSALFTISPPMINASDEDRKRMAECAEAQARAKAAIEKQQAENAQLPSAFTGVKDGMSPEAARERMRENFQAAADTIPRAFQAMAALQSVQIACQPAPDDQQEQTGIQIKDAPVKLVSLRLDSSRDTGDIERSGQQEAVNVRRNKLVQHVQEVYKQQYTGRVNFMEFMVAVLTDPALRQKVAM